MNERIYQANKMSLIISALLLTGLAIALLLAIAGEALSLARYANFETHYRVFNGEPTDLKTIHGVIADVLKGKSRAIMQLGVIILMGTPVARVALSAVTFAMEKDRQYVIISCLVLAALLYSFLSSSAGW